MSSGLKGAEMHLSAFPPAASSTNRSSGGSTASRPARRCDSSSPGPTRQVGSGGRRGDHRLGDDGVLEIADPDAPWATMRPVDTRAVPVAFTPPDDAWTCTAVAVGAGSRPARPCTGCTSATSHDGTPRGRAGGCGATRRVGPRAEFAGVVVVPGSTGVATMAPTAAVLASRGYASGVLGYVEEPGLPASMRAIPVEILAEAADAFAAVDGARLAVWAVSVGTGLALSALSGPDAPPVRGVVAISPTDVVWQVLSAGGPPPRASSLSRDSQELGWLPMHGERLLGQVLMHAVTRARPTQGVGREPATRLHVR